MFFVMFRAINILVQSQLEEGRNARKILFGSVSFYKTVLLGKVVECQLYLIAIVGELFLPIRLSHTVAG